MSNTNASQFHDYFLPSKSYPYRDASGDFLIPDGKVLIRGMTGDEQAIVNNATLTTVERMDRIIRHCTQFPDKFAQAKLEVRALLMGDRLALVSAIRSLTCGSKYEITAVCAQCRSPLAHVVDLYTDFKISQMPRVIESVDENGDAVSVTNEYNPKEGISVPTLSNGDKVVLRLLDGTHEEYMARVMRTERSDIRTNPRIASNPVYFMQRVLSIVSITGGSPSALTRKFNHSDSRDFLYLAEYIGKLPAADVAIIEDAYADHDITIDNVFPVNCGTCAATNDLILQFNEADFFRPAPTGGGRRRRP